MTADRAAPLLAIEGLRTVFPIGTGELAAVDGVDLTVRHGQTLGIVGESGCGKSMLSLSVMGLVPAPGRIAGGRVVFGGEDLAGLPPERLRQLRGKRIAMVFQEPMTSLNPVYTVGFQIVEAMRAHEAGTPYAQLRARAIAALERVRI
ncbi:MAG: ATP-binding cassette domain-containing protein, partial [Pseudomonadota bacterium]|nr:ATP-binding cassette domain-containing protein [Pseudomonadota bacterium]